MIKKIKEFFYWLTHLNNYKFHRETRDWTDKDWEEYAHADDYDRWKDECENWEDL